MSQHPFDLFGIFQFNEKTMASRLPSPVFKKWKDAVTKVSPLDRSTADAIAHEMKIWALEHGCTHYSHWFQPLTGQTAEKHDCFLEVNSDGSPIAHFSGKTLIKGETDGSSFPSGGLRATFEARGYTYWDLSSPAFIRDHVLCIPTVFVSYNGEHLDLKGPLLKALDVLGVEATRVLHALGEKKVKDVRMVNGLEQEYFLVDREMFKKRKDLLLTGRTLVGASAPKGQEFEDHYFGSIAERVQKYMDEVNLTLWKLGIFSKVEHNEVAPGQYEISPIYTEANIAVDQNQILMDVLKKTAKLHGLEALLHEKPFKGINGSGKHNNWSLSTSNGQNLFEPGDDPAENIRFLLFVSATLKAIDLYPELIRLAASGPGNDHRLGANEAPPAIVSVFMGDSIEALLFKLIDKEPAKPFKASSEFLQTDKLSFVPKDNTDRNRTSPFAFTGNKFELRMLGSSLSPAKADTIIATILADSLRDIADRLEPIASVKTVREEALKIITEIIRDHHRILFSGDGYSADWVVEAKKRGLPNIPSFVESISSLLDDKAIALFERNGVYTHAELEARSEILYELYSKTILAEARTLIEMTEREISAAVFEYAQGLSTLTQYPIYKRKLDEIVALDEVLAADLYTLKATLSKVAKLDDAKSTGLALREKVVGLLEKVRKDADLIETKLPAKCYPFPSYLDLLFLRD